MAKEKVGNKKTLSNFVDELQARGRYTFDRSQAMASLKLSSTMLKKAVMRLSAKKRIVAPKRGFFVIVPLEYRVAGAPPPSWFIDDLMRHLNKEYYVGLLSAAALYSAAHQQPQEFQVITEVPRRSMVVGRSRLRFLGKRYISSSLTNQLKTETGFMLVSTPETTALDLLRYIRSAGGISNVATVLAELTDRIESKLLLKVAQAEKEFAYIQRLGFLLNTLDFGEKSEDLAKLIKHRKPRTTPLHPGKTVKGCKVDRRWRVIVNEKIEVDL
jgi:predicted transcriptional regulator of viral defense system